MVSPPLNPYAPPKAIELARVEHHFGDFDIARAITEAWEACKRHFPLWLGALFVALVLMFLSLLTIVGYFVLIPVFAWGAWKFVLNMIDGAPSFDDLFAGFKNYLSVLGRVLLLTIITLVMGALSESLVFVGNYLESLPLTIFGWVVYVTMFAAVLIRFTFGLLLIVDRNMGAIEALGASWKMTQGKTLKMIGLFILAAFIASAGFFACGIGAFWTITMAWVMHASAYRQIVGPRASPAVIPV